MKAVRSPLAAALVAVGVVLAGCGLLDLPSPAPDPPQFDPPGGTYTEHLSVSIESPDGSVYASTDPDADVLDFEPINGDSIYVADDMVLRAYVIDDRGVRSPVAEADYLIDDVAAPVISSNELRQTNVEYFGWDIEWDASPGDDTTDPDPSDDLTDWYALEFAVYASGADDISTIEDADLNGVLVQDWHSSNSSGNIGSAHWDASSPGERRYINVFVRDEEGNVSAYGTVRMASRVALDVYAARYMPGGIVDDDVLVNRLDDPYNPSFATVAGGAPPPLEDTYAVALSDLDGDGLDDLIACYADAGVVYQGWFASLGNGSFDPTPSLFASATDEAYDIGIADFDGDGSSEVVFANSTSSVVAYNLSLAPAFSLAVTNTDRLAVGDVNGDGLPDIVTADKLGPEEVTVWLNQSGSGFAVAAQTWGGEAVTDPVDVLVDDLDLDGFGDLVVASNLSVVQVFFGDADGALTPGPAEPWAPEGTRCLGTADWDGDGWKDVIFGNDGSLFSKPTRIYFNDQSRGFTGPLNIGSTSSVTTSVTTGDLNGDGLTDFAEAFLSSAFQIWLSDGTTVSVGTGFSAGSGENALAIGRLR